MPDIAISEDQRERLRWVQNRLSEDIEYGHVRPCDALEYLLDRFDEGSGEIDVSATPPARDAEHSTQTLGNGASDPVDDGAAERVETDSNSSDSDDSDDSADSAAANSDPKTTLNSMMSLLEDNADVWRESAAGEEKYEVDLPDGSTEPARTKDDVRALLFKHYR